MKDFRRRRVGEKKGREGRKRGPPPEKGQQAAFGKNEREHWENKSKLEKAPGGRKGEVRDKKLERGSGERERETVKRSE